MPRPKKHQATVRRGIIFPLEIDVILETLHFDPINQRAKYGAINEYIISLVRRDLRERGLIP